MSNELETCLAALFLNKGKDVLTVKEFAMYVSLDLRWMQVKDANLLMDVFLKEGMLSRSGEYLKPAIDVSMIDVPVAYRPSEDLITMLREDPPLAEEPAPANDNVLAQLISIASERGIDKGNFISECNKISKRTNIDIEVAALMVLRDQGVDISPYMDSVRAMILSR